MDTYAIISTGGKQYRVSPGEVITVEKLPAMPGDRVAIDQVYLVSHDGQVSVGTPALPDTRVVAEVLGQDKAEKIIVFKHKRRKGCRRTAGHRQQVTRFRIVEIVHNGARYGASPDVPAPSPKQTAAPPEKEERSAKQRKAEKKKAEKKTQAAAPRSSEPAVPAPEPPRQETSPPVDAPLPSQPAIPAPDPPRQELQPVAENSPEPAAAPAAAMAESGREVVEPLRPAEPVPVAPPPAATTLPVEQPVVPEGTPPPPAEESETRQKEDTPAPAAAMPQPEPEPVRPMATAPQPSEDVRPAPEQSIPLPGKSATDGTHRWKIIAVLLAALVVIILLLTGKDRQPSAPGAVQNAATAPLSEPAADPRPQVREITIKQTAPVVRPEPPAQPPD